MKLPLKTDLSGKVAVVTGAGGVLCGEFSKALAAAGAKVALLNRTLAHAEAVAEEIRAQGGTAKAYQCNVLDREALDACHQAALADFGPCDILINGAGGNNPRATTDKEYFEPGDLDAETKSFFALDREGVEAVFNLNFTGVLLTTQVFARDMVGREGGNILNISSMNAYTPLTKIPAYSGAKAALPSGWQSISPRQASGSTPLHPGSSPPDRMLPCSGRRTARLLPGRRKFWPPPPWSALAGRRSCWVRCCSCWTTARRALLPALSSP